MIKRFLRDEEGQDLMEYGLLAALVSIVIAVLVQGFGQPLNTLYQVVLDALNLAGGQ